MIRRIASFILLIFPSLGWGASYVLFSAPGVQVINYDELVAKLSKGDEVVFSNGARFTIEEILGNGQTTKVLALDSKTVLRIPLARLYEGKPAGYTWWISTYLKGYSVLKEQGVPTPEVDLERSVPEEFVITSREKIEFTYEDYRDGKVKLSPEQDAKVADNLVEFARRTWKFSLIGDQGERQLVYTERGWVLLDFNESHVVAETLNDGTIFSRGANELNTAQAFGEMRMIDFRTEEKIPAPSRKLRKRMLEAIEQERLKAGFTRPPGCADFLVRPLKGFWNRLFVK